MRVFALLTRTKLKVVVNASSDIVALTAGRILEGEHLILSHGIARTILKWVNGMTRMILLRSYMSVRVPCCKKEVGHKHSLGAHEGEWPHYACIIVLKSPIHINEKRPTRGNPLWAVMLRLQHL